MYLLLLAGFSNYNNRTIRKVATPDLYVSLAESHWYITKEGTSSLLPINFKPNDGVSTTQIINDSLYDEFGNEPDYLIAFDSTDTSAECVVSRWFILEIKQTRGGQRELILRRDLIADYYEGLKTADVFVERGFCFDNDPLILNDEGMNLNKIKKGESLLKDETETPWVVAYFAKDANRSDPINIAISAPADAIDTATAAAETGLSQSSIELLINGGTINCAKTDDVAIIYTTKNVSFASAIFAVGDNIIPLPKPSGLTLPLFNAADDSIFFRNVYHDNREGIVSQAMTALSVNETLQSANALQNLGKPIEYDGNYYYLTIEIVDNNAQARTLPQQVSGALKTALDGSSLVTRYNPDGQVCFNVPYAVIRASLSVVKSANGTISLGGSTAKSLRTRPYKMLCFPLYPINVVKPTDSHTQLTRDFGGEDLALKVMAEMISASKEAVQGENPSPAKLGIIDVQLLPYCPIREQMLKRRRALDIPLFDYYFDLHYMTEGVDYDALKTGGENSEDVFYVFYCDNDSFSLNISKKYRIDTNSKYDSNAKLLRICSPNYQGSFDFNVAKNNGVEGFVVKATYKPFTPFIRVAPMFGGIYGNEFNDQRGLICGGNFSLTRTTSAWEQYELNNKNYQNIFNREIQSLDLQQSIQMRDQLIGIASGTVQGAVAGYQAGSNIGGSGAGLIGAAIGASASLMGGVVDANTLAKLQKDQRALAVDKYNYNLGNIRAIPSTITKVDTFDISSKIFPFVEEYGPTDEEKELFEEKIRLQSYTIMRIEKLGQQMTEDAPTDINQLHFVKGQLIRTDNEDIMIDSHQWDEIYAELSKGVYL